MIVLGLALLVGIGAAAFGLNRPAGLAVGAAAVSMLGTGSAAPPAVNP